MDQAKLAAAVSPAAGPHNAKAAILTTPWDQLTGAQIVSAMEGGHSLAQELMEEIGHHHTTTTTMSTATAAMTTTITTTSMSMSTSTTTMTTGTHEH